MRQWKWILAAAALIGLFLSSSGVRGARQKSKHLRKLQKKLEDIRRANKNLAMEIERLKTDPRYLEERARKELGLIQPGEIEYRFVAERAPEAEQK